MSRENDFSDGAGLQFFGIVCASISHELKNALAVINENNGLLQDLIGLSEQGRPLDPDRLKKLAANVSEQIQRADGIVKNMNRFAHSVDAAEKSVDLNEILDLVVALYGRLAAMHRINVDAKRNASPVMLTTSPLHLLNLLWRCLDFALSAAAGARAVQLAVEDTGKSVCVRFGGLAKEEPTWPARFPTEAEKTLLRRLDAELIVDYGIQEMTLRWPANNNVD